MTILMLDKTDFGAKTISQDEEGHYILMHFNSSLQVRCFPIVTVIIYKIKYLGPLFCYTPETHTVYHIQ